MTAVLDASVLIAALVDTGDDGQWAETAIVDRGLAAPHLLFVEASNILRRAALAGDLSEPEAALAHADMVGLDVELFPFEFLADRVWGLHHNLTVYDAWYVALAETLECPLLTLDTALARASGIECEVRVPGRR